MVNTRKSSQHEPPSPFISSRTRSSVKNNPNPEEQHHRDPGSNVSCSSVRLSPPSKRARRHTTPSSSDTSPVPQAKGQRVSWNIPPQRTRLSVALQNGHGNISRMNLRSEDADAGNRDHAHMNGHVELKRSCRSRKGRFEHVNQSLLFDQLVNSTAEAVLQEMDNISSIRQNREVERLRMWTDTEFENMDMYSRVKRRRKPLRRNSYSIQTHPKVMSEAEAEEEEVTEESHEEGEEDDEDVEDDDDDDDDEGDEAEEAGEENDRRYNLRQRKTVQRYEAPPIEPVNRKPSKNALFDTHRSPARRSHIRVKKHAIHSSDTTSSSDEERFERRKSKSMTRARNRCLPMNLRAEDLAGGLLRDRVKVGASLADIDPMNLDTSVRFDSIGGLRNHLQALKEMVVFPLLYPEVFEKFKIQPPRGCLFYGPPGTGKTLVARALANECSQGDRKVAFFMRKGADCLSKWVGESERQLRLLFDQAYLMRPSIIFFDEIDGLAPVRSSRQDQIHSSIVSTLLALMDGLDNRGEIVVIGATNRIDSIDPALRRPGRFDREFLFSLPDKKARKHILDIHTRDWNPRLVGSFVEELAEKCVGYCGADIKALCTEAALVALRRRYPQIYSSSQKFQLNVDSIVLGPRDFQCAMRSIVPASQRALLSPGRALPGVVRPLLESTLSEVLACLLRVFPHAEPSLRDDTGDGDNQLLEEDSHGDYDDHDDGAPSIFDVHSGSPKKQAPQAGHRPFLRFTELAYQQPLSCRPRLLLAGDRGSGQTTHLAPAVLHHLERFSVQRLDLSTMYSVSVRSPEECCTQVFREARRCLPSVVYIPHISEWWDAMGDTVRSTFLSLLRDVPSFCPLLVLATAETAFQHLPDELKRLFTMQYGEVVHLRRPTEDDRRKFFQDLILVQAAQAPSCNRRAARRALEVLLPVEDPGPRQLSPEEQRRLEEQEENTLRELRLFLRDVTKRLATDKRFSIFSKPVDIEEVSDYLEVITQPMDLSTIMTKIDTRRYLTVKDFLTDIDLICSNALEYNPDKDPGDKIIRHRACSLKDTAHAIFASELDPEFNRMCEEIKESKKKRGSLSEPQQPVPLLTLATKKTAGGEEPTGTAAQAETAENTPARCINQIKRKAKRRPSWGRGIIRKKRTYLKKEEVEGEEPEEGLESGGGLEADDTAEESNTAGPSDSCLTQDEDSCDTMDTPQGGPQPNGYALSTEEESSNEPPVGLAGPQPEAEKASLPGRPQECMNGDESLDSLDSEANKRSSEGGGEEAAEDGESAVEPKSSELEASEGDLDKEGASTAKKCKRTSLEQQKAAQAEETAEDSPPPPPPLVVDHERLANLLEKVIQKSEGYTVDQLERLYSVLSQCIYQHRGDYDKTLLTEEMERRVEHFQTFL
ncbi:ATPase family AAA domain-containing protein 2B isoform X2 [Paramormyrops kingsleyae]|uniref:ATPase family AAA domain-containing protein 2 n=1 Tax=Paramormyrops kingsleyae TaxID=1676925 RepID=A0A3B3RKU1_9TELE|nr:ATPase family AAA domain-containing protein 2B isoform X2 [Paramormyrops kingsleyae]